MANIDQNIVGFTGNVNQLKTWSEPEDVLNSDVPKVERIEGSWLIIPAKMRRLIPLPIPYSVISSPSHISKIAPADIAPTATIHSMAVGSPRAVELLASTV